MHRRRFFLFASLSGLACSEIAGFDEFSASDAAGASSAASGGTSANGGNRSGGGGSAGRASGGASGTGGALADQGGTKGAGSGGDQPGGGAGASSTGAGPSAKGGASGDTGGASGDTGGGLGEVGGSGSGKGGAPASGGAPGEGGGTPGGSASGGTAVGGSSGGSSAGGATGSGGSAAGAGEPGAGGEAGEVGGCDRQLLSNADFESGSTVWEESTNFPSLDLIVAANDADLLEVGVTPYAGNYLAWLGGVPDTSQGHLMTLIQEVTIPVDATSLVLTGFVRIETEETEPGLYDILWLELLTAPEEVLALMHTYTNEDATDGWVPIEIEPLVELDDFGIPGSTLLFQIHCETDPEVPTSFFFDDLRLVADCAR